MEPRKRLKSELQPERSRIAFHRVYPGGSNNWQLHASLHRAHRLPPGLSRWGQQLAATRLAAPRSNSFAWGFAPSGVRGGGAMGSCQSWLHRHKAGGGRDQA